MQKPIVIKYITALSLDEIRCLIKEDTIQLNLFSKHLAEIESEGTRYILCANPDLEMEHSQTRAGLKYRFEETLHEIKLSYQARQHKNNENKTRVSNGDKNKKLVTQFSQKQIDGYKYRVRKALEKYNMQSFYHAQVGEEQFCVEFDFEKYDQARQLDVKYVIVTNVAKETMAKETVRQEYKNLKNVEHAFRDMKTVKLNVRPIFHVNDDTTRGHVFVTMFVYAIVQELENRIFPWLKLNNKNSNQQLSLKDIEEELKMIKLNVIEINGQHQEIKITELTNMQTEIFQSLDIKPESMIV